MAVLRRTIEPDVLSSSASLPARRFELWIVAAITSFGQFSTSNVGRDAFILDSPTVSRAKKPPRARSPIRHRQMSRVGVWTVAPGALAYEQPDFR